MASSHWHMTEEIELAEDLHSNPFVPHRIFINHVDQFNSRHFASYITDQICGLLKSHKEEIVIEGEEEMAEEEYIKPRRVSLKGNRYEVIGTLKHGLAKPTEDISRIVSDNDSENFVQELLNCGYIIFDITQDNDEIRKALAILSAIQTEIEKIKDIGPKTFDSYDRVFVIILISSVVTWGNTKPLDPNDITVPFTERYYKKRKPHPNAQNEIMCEKEFLQAGKKYKDKLKTYVICAGIIYGFEEDDLFFLFKLAWNNEECMPILSPGNNIVPFIHIEDLCKVIHHIIELQPKKIQYILAVEQTPCTFKNLIKCISRDMTTGRVIEIDSEEAFLYPNMTQYLFDRYTLNLNMEPAFIVDSLGIEWKSDLNIADNMKQIIDEFRKSRRLEPKRILIHGPPVSGKTTLAKKITEYYGVHYISVKTMIEETLEKLRLQIEDEIERREKKEAIPSDPEAENLEDQDEEEVIDIDEKRDRIKHIETLLENDENGKLPDNMVIKLMKDFLKNNFCQNQGYVLDGYPKNIIQVKELFGFDSEYNGEEAVEEELEEVTPIASIIPMYVISLEASDQFLCERVMNMPEKIVQDSHYTEEQMLRRLREFRETNTEDDTILNFFDEIEIHPIIINVEDNIDVVKILEKARSTVGLPIGFQLSPEEQDELRKCQEEADRLKEEEQDLEKELLEHEALEEYQRKMEEKIMILEDLQIEEERLLTAECEPLRSYLMKYVFPTLTEGLLEVARMKPEDPIDYLAEYLFRCNPEGKMFDPTYSRQGELLEKIVKSKTG